MNIPDINNDKNNNCRIQKNNTMLHNLYLKRILF